MKLKDYITEDSVIFVDATSKEEVIEKQVEKAYSLGKIKDKAAFTEAIFDREHIVSTGIGLGVAVPHVKLDGIEEFFVIVAISKQAIDWDSIDRKPVLVSFMIGGPDGQQKKYLQIMSKLMLLIKKDDRREKIFSAKESLDLCDLFKNF